MAMVSSGLASVQSSLRVGLGKVLVVEDEELIRETVALALAEEGFELVVAADGPTALEKLLGSADGSKDAIPDINLVILDLMLPGMNGLDLCRLVRHRGLDVPILILSAKGTEMDRVVGLEVGADDYLSKPFGMRELIARCRALLRRYQSRSKSEDSSALRFEGLTLHPNECRAFLNDVELNLSPKEFKILELFMGRPRRVWSRDQIIDRVWGYDFMGDNKTVDVHIRWLREKLEEDPSKPKYLKTVRGFGYRLG
ncbi:response regulator with -like receiver domain protein and winged-helix dna-binding domain protein [Leptolyngbya sp. Heron Island J]|uniref:response regulator transcription factor n=1 Tax=Leptolyngbya sp. Heron Island J TaxID=1385935 RepID=UPI0003B9B4CF|nr:response regulator transcription factor [Leptolyngbya sp. Heron Island J]ESA32582.1 response regulator with -like receiver domain protein and winged-helix dna-binding domain protein [Leptolyngbya sp. Heron Island J]